MFKFVLNYSNRNDTRSNANYRRPNKIQHRVKHNGEVDNVGAACSNC